MPTHHPQSGPPGPKGVLYLRESLTEWPERRRPNKIWDTNASWALPSFSLRVPCFPILFQAPPRKTITLKRFCLATLSPPSRPEDQWAQSGICGMGLWAGAELPWVFGFALFFPLFPFPLSPFFSSPSTRGYEALYVATPGSPCPSSPSWLRARAVALSARTASPLLPSALRPPKGAGERLGGARSGAWPHLPGRLFLGLLRATGRWLLLLASRGALSSSPAPARLQPDSSPAPVLLRSRSGPAPVLLRPCSSSPPPRLSWSSAPWPPALAAFGTSVPRRPALPRPRAPPSPCARSSTPTTPPQPSALSLALSICPSVGLSVRLPTLLFLPLSRFSGLFPSSTWRSGFAGKSQKPLQKAYNEI